MKTPDTEKLYQEKELAYQMKATGNRSQTDHTPDTESEEMKVVGTLHCILADISGYEPDGEVYTLVEQAHKELAKLRNAISSRDTYWKESVHGEWYIGKELHVFGGVYEVVGLSTMRDECEGEPEWEITHKIQEVAIAEKHEGITYQKPSWHKVSELTPTTITNEDNLK